MGRQQEHAETGQKISENQQDIVGKNGIPGHQPGNCREDPLGKPVLAQSETILQRKALPAPSQSRWIRGKSIGIICHERHDHGLVVLVKAGP